MRRSVLSSGWKRFAAALSALLLVSLTLVCLYGCDRRPAGPWRIAVVVKTSESDFFQTLRKGAEAASKEYNATIEFVGPTRENEVDLQIEMLNAVIDRQPDAILLAAADYDRLADAASRAVEHGIPIISVDSGVNLDTVSSVIETDNHQVGAKVGYAMAEATGGKATVLVVNFVAGTSTADARQDGFLDAVANYSGIEIVDIVFCNSQEQLARQLVHEGMAARPDIDVIVGLNAHSTIGAGRAILDREEQKIDGSLRLFGVDSTPEEVLHLEIGRASWEAQMKISVVGV